MTTQDTAKFDAKGYVQRNNANWARATEHFKAIKDELKSLRARLKAVEDQPMPKWCGAYRQGEAYAPMSLCVDRGALWIAKVDTTTRPGSDASWQLCAKSFKS